MLLAVVCCFFVAVCCLLFFLFSNVRHGLVAYREDFLRDSSKFQSREGLDANRSVPKSQKSHEVVSRWWFQKQFNVHSYLGGK